jgi:hypothetical protein
MFKFGFLASAAMFALGFSPAVAQSSAPSFDQYPSFIELSATTNDETQSVLRCGYAANGGQVALDPGYHEISVMNQNHHTYSRIQRVDNYLIATSIDPSSGQNLLVELVKPDGSLAAKNCQSDTESDTISNCRSISPFTFVDQIKAGDQQIATRCADLMRQAGSKINPSLADPQKTQAFKIGLEQKVNTLAAP